MVDTSIVTFAGVAFSYSKEKRLLNELSLQLRYGTFYLIQGRSGTGKSTVLRLINRLEEPSAGEILFKGQPLPSYHPPMLRRLILYIQQIPTVMDGSVRENLGLPFSFKNNRDLTKPTDDQLIMLLNDFHLDGVSLDDNAQNLSVGQLQRICFIRGLLLSPEILLLDEPTSALDQTSSEVVESMAERLCQEYGRTVVMVSHREFEPRRTTFVVLEVENGQVREI